jgi:hypothetical protein
MASNLSVCEFEDWIYECGHYLHTARIYMEYHSVKPKMRYGNAVNYIDSIMREITKKTEISSEKTDLLVLNKDGDSIYIPEIFINFTNTISKEESDSLKLTLKKIGKDDWDNLSPAEIESSHEILYRLLQSVKNGTKKIKTVC